MQRLKLGLARFVIGSALLGASLAPLPAQAQICAPFTDVLASSAFCDDIQWIYNRGITLGCVGAPPGQTWYCPADFVRRDQMAAFLYRLGLENAFLDGGNAFSATAVLGTTDNQALDIRVNGGRVMRYEPNAVSPSVVGGSPANFVTADVRGATISGGGVPGGDTDPYFAGEAPNRVTDAYGTVGGGYDNQAGDDAVDVVNAGFASVGGGRKNAASNAFSTVAGGFGNTASGPGSVVGGGSQNTASGDLSVVPGGLLNDAAASFSVAIGHRAKVLAHAPGSFVYSDATDADFVSGVPNEFIVGATGGIGMYTSKTYATYCRIGAGGGAWSCSSSRDVKRDFAQVDSVSVLEKVLALPMSSWRFVGEPIAIRHLGPMSQDFHAAFGLGSDDRSIASVDAQGVALAAIQGLNAKLEAQTAAQARELASLRAQHAAEMDEMRRTLDLLSARLNSGIDRTASR